MESAGTGNLFSIPENDENPDVPADKDIPLTKGAAGPSAEPSPSFFMNREEPQEEVSSVKDSVTSDVAKKNLTEGSTGVLEEQPVGIGKKWTLEHSWATEGFEFKKPETNTGTTKEKGGDFILDPMVKIFRLHSFPCNFPRFPRVFSHFLRVFTRFSACQKNFIKI